MAIAGDQPATPQRVEWKMGNGDVVICANGGGSSSGCSYTYSSSSVSKDEQRYVIETTVIYLVEGVEERGPTTRTPVVVSEAQSTNIGGDQNVVAGRSYTEDQPTPIANQRNWLARGWNTAKKTLTFGVAAFKKHLELAVRFSPISPRILFDPKGHSEDQLDLAKGALGSIKDTGGWCSASRRCASTEPTPVSTSVIRPRTS